MAAPTFRLCDEDGGTSGSTACEVYHGVWLRIDVDWASHAWGATVGWRGCGIEWDWDDDGADYNAHDGGFNSAHYYESAGTYTPSCTITNLATGESTTATWTITVSASSRTAFWVDGTGSGTADGSSEANAAAALASGTNRHIIVTADVEMTSAFTIAHDNLMIECRNGARLIDMEARSPSSGSRLLSVDADDVTLLNVRTTHETFNAATATQSGLIEQTSGKQGLTLIRGTFGGYTEQMLNVADPIVNGTNPTFAGSTRAGDILIVDCEQENACNSYAMWFGGNAEYSDPANSSTLNAKNIVLFGADFTAGCYEEAVSRGSGDFLFWHQCDFANHRIAVSDGRWDESAMTFYSNDLADVRLKFPADIGFDAGTGVTTGRYKATASTTGPGGVPGLVLATSPSTSNVDLTTGDIETELLSAGGSGGKDLLRLMSFRWAWIEQSNFLHTVVPSEALAPGINSGPSTQSSVLDNADLCLNRLLHRNCFPQIEIDTDVRRILARACVMDGAYTDSLGRAMGTRLFYSDADTNTPARSDFIFADCTVLVGTTAMSTFRAIKQTDLVKIHRTVFYGPNIEFATDRKWLRAGEPSETGLVFGDVYDEVQDCAFHLFTDDPSSQDLFRFVSTGQTLAEIEGTAGIENNIADTFDVNTTTYVLADGVKTANPTPYSWKDYGGIVIVDGDKVGAATGRSGPFLPLSAGGSFLVLGT